jgi:tetratricopeptide (TPR) repeat protein
MVTWHINNYKKSLKIKPDYAEAHLNLGYVRQDEGDLDAAIASYKQALKIQPDYAKAFYNTSLVNLSLQDFEVGWPLYEWRWKLAKVLSNPLKSTKPLWKPSKKQRVLLWGEQGVGDEIMFGSLIPDLYSSSSKLIVLTDKRLIPLFRRSFPDDIECPSGVICLTAAILNSWVYRSPAIVGLLLRYIVTNWSVY